MAKRTSSEHLERVLKRLAFQREAHVEELRQQALKHGLEHLERLERARALEVDVLLVTATSTEFAELQKAATAARLSSTRVRGKASVYLQLGVLNHDRVAAIKLSEIGSFSKAGSAVTCSRAIAETGATSIVVVGTAFGVDDSTLTQDSGPVQRIGDVLVSEALHRYDHGDVKDDLSVLGYRYDYSATATVTASERWVKHLRTAWSKWQHTNGTEARAHFGVLLAGGARIESQTFRDHLVARVPATASAVIGGEMEAEGVAAVCSADGVDWVVVKGISDFATAASRANIKATRGTAAARAAAFTLFALQQPWGSE